MEKRKFLRVTLSTRAILTDKESIYQAQMVNISTNGALIRLDHGDFLDIGDQCHLAVYIDAEDHPMEFIAETVFFNFSMAGLKFLSYGFDSEERISLLVASLSKGSDTVMAEQANARKRLSGCFLEE